MIIRKKLYFYFCKYLEKFCQEKMNYQIKILKFLIFITKGSSEYARKSRLMTFKVQLNN